MATTYENYKKAKLTFTDDSITWYNPAADENWEVMMSWEKPIMEKMAEICVNEGDHVLECGFGMGILSDAIQARKPASHTICEYHPDIIPKMREWRYNEKNYASDIRMWEAKWFDLLNNREIATKYDAILMDTYADDDLHGKFVHFCNQKGKDNCKISWWNFSGGTTDDYMKFYWEDVTFTDVAISPPENQYYNRKVYHVPLKILKTKKPGYGFRGRFSDDGETEKLPQIAISETKKEYRFLVYPTTDVLTVDINTGEFSTFKPTSNIGMQGSGGMYFINDDLLHITGNHPITIKRDGVWVDKLVEELVVGDKLYKIDKTEVEITKIDKDESDKWYTAHCLETDKSYFVNDILVKGGVFS